ncbi:MAG: helix-turn-helix domain-containing protein [Myxococcota bacterium]
MDGGVEDPTPLIARRLRGERGARGWSLADLAARSGVSKAMISKIEREEASPTAAILGRLSGAFQLTLATLLARAESDDGRLVRAADQPRWRDPETHYLRRQIFARPRSPLELVEVEMPAGRTVSMPAASYAFIRQLVFVTRGRLVIREGGERHELRTGDCLEFGAPADSSFANESKSPCRYLVALVRQ